MESNQTYWIVECVSWQEENEEDGQNKNTTWQNSRDR